MEKLALRKLSSIKRVVEHDSFPSHAEDQIKALRRNSYAEYDITWNKFYLESRNEFQSVQEYMLHQLIPELAGDIETNSFRLAVALSFVDSRKLPSPIREAIGLPGQFSITDEMEELETYPELLVPDEDTRWTYQCGRANSYLRYTMRKFEGIMDPEDEKGQSVALELAGCMIGKVNGHYSGLCFQTTEFPNGSVFVKDIWYEIRNQTLKDKLSSLTCNAGFEKKAFGDVLYTEGSDPIITKDMIVWKGCGGVWQPTRSISHQETFATEIVLDTKDI